MPSTIGAPAQAENVGILACEVYFPSSYVRQQDLEARDGVPAGKYTAGLGQQGLSFCGDREDPVSMALTALQQLMERHGVTPADIGRLEVGTESELDGSKSIKSHLMMLFEESGNSDVDGVDCVQACYGGTAAVLNAAAWVESRAWDGRLAAVVCSDIALYAPGPARATSGAGAVALLVGPDAPLALERGLCATHFAHAYDFYKPAGLYPTVDGPLSVYCYLQTLDRCLARYSEKFEKRVGRPFSIRDDVDHALFHAPYNKLVQKAFSRLTYHDLSRRALAGEPLGAEADEALGAAGADLGDGSHPRPPTQLPRELERAVIVLAAREFDDKVRPSTCVQCATGNMYTASLWSGIAQLLETRGPGLVGCRVLLYSYGSGISAALLSLVGREVEGRFSLGRLQAQSDLDMRLARRIAQPAQVFERAAQLAEQRYGTAGYKPEQPALEELEPGTYYLVRVDDRHRRQYARKPA